MALDRSERLTVGLLGVFLGTLALVVAADSLLAWLAWSAAMIVLTGTVLILVNRSATG